MLNFLKRTSFIALLAIGGALSAIFGAICGWILFPLLVGMNVKKVGVLTK